MNPWNYRNSPPPHIAAIIDAPEQERQAHFAALVAAQSLPVDCYWKWYRKYARKVPTRFDLKIADAIFRWKFTPVVRNMLNTSTILLTHL